MREEKVTRVWREICFIVMVKLERVVCCRDDSDPVGRNRQMFTIKKKKSRK